MKYEKFKLELVAEYAEHDGTTSHVSLHLESHAESVKYLCDVHEDQTCLRIFWVIYGITPEGWLEPLAEGENDQDMKAKFDFLQGLIEVSIMYKRDIGERIAKEDYWRTTNQMVEEKLK